ncbi:MAG: hypothetical protein QOH89_29 [Pseudonocardiales bacterium]|nr:hypothetical protein [Pseudonocardiales bacterium]
MSKETPVPRQSSLVPVLLVLTATTGIVDAVSYLGMGHVLVANMTGNVVFLGFALAGAAGFSIASFLVAIASFLVGALLGGRLGATLGDNRRRWLVVAAVTQTALATIAAIMTAAGVLNTAGNERLGVIALLGVGMGVQNATVRRLAVPDMTTTVLTMTLTGLAADSTPAGGGNPRPRRRLASVAAMLAGGVAGAALMLHSSAAVSIGVFAAILAVAAAALALTPDQPDNPAA